MWANLWVTQPWIILKFNTESNFIEFRAVKQIDDVNEKWLLMIFTPGLLLVALYKYRNWGRNDGRNEFLFYEFLLDF